MTSLTNDLRELHNPLASNADALEHANAGTLNPIFSVIIPRSVITQLLSLNHNTI